MKDLSFEEILCTDFNRPQATHFVYVLRDDFKRRIFYVGKGSANRPRDHLNEAKRFRRGLPVSNVEKCKRIVQIEDAGGEVQIDIIKRFEVEADAYAYEALVIDRLREKLTNFKPGSNPWLRKKHLCNKWIPICIEKIRYWRWAAKTHPNHEGIKFFEDGVARWLRYLRWYLSWKQDCYGKS